MTDPFSIGGWIASIILGGMAVWQKKRGDIKEIEKNQIAERTAVTTQTVCDNSQSLLAARDQLITQLEKTLADYQAQFKRIQEENAAARDYWHRKNEESQQLLLRLTEENAKLKTATDMTPVLTHLESVSSMLKQISETMLKVVNKLNVQ